tara:strand:- start:24 stop:245 length:222 start_codon:yes stop_codon:yes gene_type:complete
MKNLLFTVTLTTHDWTSEYGCLFIVAAKNEDDAKAIIDESEGPRYSTGYDLDIQEIGIAKAGLGCGIIEQFTT